MMDSQNNNLKDLLEENLKKSDEILNNIKSMRRIAMFGQAMSFLKLAVVIVFLILGFLYVSPFLKQALTAYSEIMGQFNQMRY